MILHHGDCLDILESIPDKSIDLILTDPPYNIGKAKWDKIPNYAEWCGKWFLECQRVLKNNGSFYWWHNDMVQISQLMEWLRVNSKFVFNSFVIWDKGNFRSLSWKNPSKESNLRSWFNTCEYCLYYTFNEKGDITARGETFKHYDPIIKYMIGERKKIMDSKKFKTIKQFNSYINDITGTSSSVSRHYFAYSQWRPPTKDLYRKLQDTGYFKTPYEQIKTQYESLSFVHHIDKNHNNVWKSNQRNNGRFHVCEKPQDLMERIIKTSSNTGDTVLDLFMGSGSTGLACINTGRDFIGIEKDDRYFEIAKNRLLIIDKGEM